MGSPDKPTQRAPNPEGKGRSEPMPPTAAPPAQEALVPFSTRVTESMRRRTKVYAAAKGVGVQDVVQAALEEYLSKHGY